MAAPPQPSRALFALFALFAVLTCGSALSGCVDPADPADPADPVADTASALDSDAGADTVDAAPSGPLSLVVVTFNTGSGSELKHDEGPDDGYGSTEAAISDEHYGNGLAWNPVVANVRAFFEAAPPDLVAFQEIFHPGACASIPADAHAGFFCATYRAGDPTVAQHVLGADFQVACHPGKPDKCLAVHGRLGRFRGCDGDLCLSGLTGFPVPGCGSGARVARGVIDLQGGRGTLTVVHIHGTSGFSSDDVACRVAQVDQIFVDLGDGQPGANGERNVILGDLNTDPARAAGVDLSADRWADFTGDGAPFAFVSDLGTEVPATYGGFFNIDHVVSDGLRGTCRVPGLDTDPDLAPATDARYFDHLPLVCTLQAD